MNAVSNSVVMYKNGGYDPSTQLLAAMCGGGGGDGDGGGRWLTHKHNGVKVFSIAM